MSKLSAISPRCFCTVVWVESSQHSLGFKDPQLNMSNPPAGVLTCCNISRSLWGGLSYYQILLSIALLVLITWKVNFDYAKEKKWWNKNRQERKQCQQKPENVCLEFRGKEVEMPSVAILEYICLSFPYKSHQNKDMNIL